MDKELRTVKIRYSVTEVRNVPMTQALTIRAACQRPFFDLRS